MFEFLIQHQPGCLLLVLAVLSTAACAAHYKPHPGALNVTDSVAYDTLLAAETAIEEARTQNQTRPLPGRAKDALNAVIDSYNIARTAWLMYRGAIATNAPSHQYFQQLARNLTDLTSVLEALTRADASASPIGRSHQ
jgi:hypothetical protein